MVKKTAFFALVLVLFAPLSVIAQSSTPSSAVATTSTSPSQSSAPSNGNDGAGIGSAIAPGSVGSSQPDGAPASPQGGVTAGASGSDNGSVSMSRGAEIAVIVVVVLVALGGISSAVFYYIAKKRQWEVRKSIRRSAVRIKNNLSTTNLSLKSPRRQTGVTRLAEPPTPRGHNKNRDLEKGNMTPTIKTTKAAASGVKSEFEVESPVEKRGVSGFGKKLDR